MPPFLSSLFDRLAISHLTRNGNKACVLLPEDNALILRDCNFIPVFASEETDTSVLGAIFLNALMHVVCDQSGEMNLRDAVDRGLEGAKADMTVRVAFERIFDNAHLAKASAR